jgi:hypothetical protein
MPMKKILLLLTLPCAGFAAPAFAQSACTTIPAVPYTINAPGNYCLAGPQVVNLTLGVGITISADDVDLDCRNFSIRNTATSSGSASVGIQAGNRHGITIRNCRVLGGFHTAIKLSQNNTVPNEVYYMRLLDNYIAGPFVYGIWANGSAIEIVNNRIYDVGGRPSSLAAGIRLGAYTGDGPKFHVVKDNLVAGTTSTENNAYGVLSDLSQAGIFTENAVSGTTALAPEFRSYGFRVIAGTYNRITDNHIVSGGLDNDTGVRAVDATTSCYDNYIRSPQPTLGCNAALGNE